MTADRSFSTRMRAKIYKSYRYTLYTYMYIQGVSECMCVCIYIYIYRVGDVMAEDAPTSPSVHYYCDKRCRRSSKGFLLFCLKTSIIIYNTYGREAIAGRRSGLLRERAPGGDTGIRDETFSFFFLLFLSPPPSHRSVIPLFLFIPISKKPRQSPESDGCTLHRNPLRSDGLPGPISRTVIIIEEDEKKNIATFSRLCRRRAKPREIVFHRTHTYFNTAEEFSKIFPAIYRTIDKVTPAAHPPHAVIILNDYYIL